MTPQAVRLYGEKTDHVADDEIRARRRHRPTSSHHTPGAPTAAVGPPAVEISPPAARSRHACPTCGHEPASREEAAQQRADLAVTWLQLDKHGDLATAHHCATCAPSGAGRRSGLCCMW
jgi:hypothetical protein